jgi:hypothetical protein
VGNLRRSRTTRTSVARKIGPEEQTTANLERMVHTYAALLKAHPRHILDASWFPSDKQTMIELFQKMWLAADKAEMRKMIEDWWCLLARFQSGVGGVPRRPPQGAPTAFVGVVYAEDEEGVAVAIEETTSDRPISGGYSRDHTNDNPPLPAALQRKYPGCTEAADWWEVLSDRRG